MASPPGKSASGSPVDGTAAAAAAVVHTFRGDLLHTPQSAIQRLRDGVRTCDDFVSLLRERVAIEETYARSLANLSRNSVGSLESGSLSEVQTELAMYLLIMPLCLVEVHVTYKAIVLAVL